MPSDEAKSPSSDKVKVYCKECDYYNVSAFAEFMSDEFCEYPDNIGYGSGDYARRPKKGMLRFPWQINKNNDCQWFKGKKRWW